MSKKEKAPKSQKEEKSQNKKSSSGRLPVLFDVSFSISKLVVILIGVITSVISVLSRATIITAAFRGCLAMLAIGIILWLINWIMVRESLSDVLSKIQKLQSQTSDGASTMEKNA